MHAKLAAGASARAQGKRSGVADQVENIATCHSMPRLQGRERRRRLLPSIEVSRVPLRSPTDLAHLRAGIPRRVEDTACHLSHWPIIGEPIGHGKIRPLLLAATPNNSALIPRHSLAGLGSTPGRFKHEIKSRSPDLDSSSIRLGLTGPRHGIGDLLQNPGRVSNAIGTTPASQCVQLGSSGAVAVALADGLS